MKEFDPILNKPDKIEIVNQKQVEYKRELLGSTVRHKGHTMYEIDCSTGEIKEAEYEDEKVIFVPMKDLITGIVKGSSQLVVRDILCRENCLYIGALNLKSVRKKYMKWVVENTFKNISEL